MSALPSYKPSSDRVAVWQCIGCGRIEMPQPCIDVCKDKKVELVYAEVFDRWVAHATQTSNRIELLESLVRKLAFTKPHEGEWEHSYNVLQKEAREVLAKPDAQART
jgi:hypothetical protein